jgi:hypothetical protein
VLQVSEGGLRRQGDLSGHCGLAGAPFPPHDLPSPRRTLLLRGTGE